MSIRGEVQQPPQTTVPGAKGQLHTIVDDASHFNQDDKPGEYLKK